MALTQSEIDRLGREFEEKREAIDNELANRREATLGPVIREYVSRMQRLAGDATRAGKLTEVVAAREAVAKVIIPGQWRMESAANGVSTARPNCMKTAGSAGLRSRLPSVSRAVNWW